MNDSFRCTMIEIKYKALFDIEFLHDFYTGGKCTDIILEPTPDCHGLLHRAGLRFIPTPFGGKVFCKVKTVGGKDIARHPLPEGTKFSFIMRLTDSRFQNFTEINSNKPRTSHYYFNNLVNNLSASSAPLLVANTSTKLVSDQDLLPFVSNQFSFTENNTSPTQNSELAFTDSGESFQQSLNNYNNTFNFSYDLRKTPGGRAKFFIDGVEKAAVYVDHSLGKDIFGAVEIFFKTNLPAAYQFQKADNAVETRNYKIVFLRVATKWRYIITKKFNAGVTAVTVGKTSGTPIQFTPGTGATADQFIMVSANPVPLGQAPIAGIKLSDQSDKIIIANLPNPSLTLVKTEGADTFSDILITI